MPTYRGTAQNDRIDQAALGLPDWTDIQTLAGNDTVDAGISRVDPGAGNDSVTANSAWTTLIYWSSPSAIRADLQTGLVQDGWGTTDTLVNVHTLQGSNYADHILGSRLADEFWAGNGDFFDGRSGLDTVVIWDSASNWTWSWSAARTLSITRRDASASVVVSNVEVLRFNDSTFNVSSVFSQDRVFSDLVGRFPAGAFTTVTGADLNADGLLDIVVTAGVFPPLTLVESPPRILLQHTDGSFREAALSGTVEGFVHPREIAQGDFNGDGRIDLIVVGHGYDTAPFPGETAALLLADGTGYRDASEWLPSVNAFTHSVTVGDVNHDGRDDIYLGNIWGQNQVAPKLLLALPAGGFVEADLPARVGSEALGARGVAPIASLLADINQDGHTDLLVGSGSAGNWLFLGNRDAAGSTVGLFDATGIRLPAGLFGAENTITVDILAIDVNADGRLDLVLSQTAESPFYAGRGLQILIQQSNGAFVDESSARLPGFDASAPWAMFVDDVDLNGDGHVDLLLNGSSLTAPSAFMNAGNGVFLPAGPNTGFPEFSASVALSNQPGQVFSVSLDNSGKVAVDRITSALGATGPDNSNPADLGAPGFNEAYYLLTQPQVAASVAAGIWSSGLEHYLAQGRSAGYAAFAPGTWVYGSAGSDRIVLDERDAQANGLAGDDSIDGGAGDDRLDGGAGLDHALYHLPRASFDTARIDTHIRVTGPEGVDTLVSVERAIFTDGALGFDVDGTGGQACRLYQAAFDRVPDEAGLGFWIYVIDRGFSLVEAAAAFMNSNEFRGLYGTDPTNEEFLSLLYRNVMNREFDNAGKLYWLDALDGNGLFLDNPLSRAAVLTEFSESAENQANVIGVISDGFEYLPYTPA